MWTKRFFWSQGAGPPTYLASILWGNIPSMLPLEQITPAAMQIAGLLDSNNYENHLHSLPCTQFEKSIFTM